MELIGSSYSGDNDKLKELLDMSTQLLC
jgi:hypothetical protein